jgi:hypothetical protein
VPAALLTQAAEAAPPPPAEPRASQPARAVRTPGAPHCQAEVEVEAEGLSRAAALFITGFCGRLGDGSFAAGEHSLSTGARRALGLAPAPPRGRTHGHARQPDAGGAGGSSPLAVAGDESGHGLAGGASGPAPPLRNAATKPELRRWYNQTYRSAGRRPGQCSLGSRRNSPRGGHPDSRGCPARARSQERLELQRQAAELVEAAAAERAHTKQRTRSAVRKCAPGRPDAPALRAAWCCPSWHARVQPCAEGPRPG